MARAIWTGALSFGLVNVPIGLYTATDDKTVHFNQLERGTSDRVRNKRVNERTGEEVPYDAIVKGYDLGGGRFVIVEPEELEAVQPERSRFIEITDFVSLDEIDPVYYKSSYYLAPQGAGAERAYALLREAMEKSRKVGIATFVMRAKEYLVLVRPESHVLVLETMYFPDEIRDPVAELGTLPGADTNFTAREIDTAELLIDSMTSEFDPERYHDTYRQAVEDLIERKSRGEIISTEVSVPEPAPVIDLMDALRASVEAARQKRAGADGAPVATPARSATPHEGSAGRASTKAAPEQPPAAKTRSAAAAAGGRSAARPAAFEHSSMSKTELSGLAAKLNIPGRSRMSRDELEAAVAKATAEAGSVGKTATRRRKAS